MKKLVVEYLPMDSLTAYDGNAKEHPKKQVDEIVQSIKQFGFDDPIAVWGKNNAIVEGHGRLLALQKMSEKDRAKAGVEGGARPHYPPGPFVRRRTAEIYPRTQQDKHGLWV